MPTMLPQRCGASRLSTQRLLLKPPKGMSVITAASSRKLRLHGCLTIHLCWRVLEAALRDSLQVKLGFNGDQIHEVEMVSHLGSAARPIWIVDDFRLCCEPDSGGQCTNVPTIQAPSATEFNNIPRAVTWCGQAYFNEGVWRFLVGGVSSRLLIDGCNICGTETQQSDYQKHAYLKGMHKVELQIKDYVCSSTFQMRIYRIR